jgi:nucleotide-binding universal stress UspA family protein
METKDPAICPSHWRRLLVCCDGSAEARQAVFQTLALARACGSRVGVLRVVEIIPEVEAVAPDLRAQQEREVREEMKAIRAEAAGMKAAVEILIRQSQLPHAAIVAEAEKFGADLIIMGRSGRTGLARLLLGSVTARVIGHSAVNVLVMPRGASLSLARLLVALDASPPSEAAWQEAVSLAKSGEVQLFAVAAAPEEGEIIEAQGIIRQHLEAANREGIHLRGILPQGQQPDDAIVQAALRNEVDLIIMGSHGRTGLTKLLMGSVTQGVIGQAPCPVLVVKKV